MALNLPGLLIVADRDYVGDDGRWTAILRELASSAAGSQVLLQVRCRSAGRQRLIDLAARAREVVPASVPLFLNGPADVAAELGYDGVHWPERHIPDVPPAVTLHWRSAAVHSSTAVLKAERAGADFMVFGSVFEPGSKSGEAAGLAVLGEVVAAASRPVIAVGGITPGRVRSCLIAGAGGIAVVSGVLGVPSPGQALREYLTALEDAHQSGGMPAGNPST